MDARTDGWEAPALAAGVVRALPPPQRYSGPE